MIPILEWYFGIEGTPVSPLTDSPLPALPMNAVECVYDNRSADPTFQTWGLYSTSRPFSEAIRLVAQEDSVVAVAGVRTSMHVKSLPVALLVEAASTDEVGVNKALPYLTGTAVFEYQALESASSSLNLLFCVIPMQRDRPDGQSLIEVGAQHCAEPENAFSPYRYRFFVPREHVKDGLWHQATIEYDSRRVPTVDYAILAPRINEGCPKPASGTLLVRNAQLYTAAKRART
jgi:hypothetical protein